MSFTKIAAAGIGSTETVTLHSLEVLNNATIGGVLTYEDVTNVDSIGIITARAGVLVGSGITLSKDGDGFFTGVVTATSYAGDGSSLTGIAATDNVRTGILDVAGVGTFRNDVNIPDKIIHLGDTNTAIRFPADDKVTVETSGTERFAIEPAGNVNAPKSVVVGTGLTVGTSGSTSVFLGQGHIELTRSSGDAHIDFKDAFADDFDTRIISTNTSQLQFFTGGVGASAIALQTNTGKVAISTVPVGGEPTVAKLQIHSDKLGGTAGNTQEMLYMISPDISNATSYRFTNYRHTNGTSHVQSEGRLRRHVDATDMGFLGLGDGYVNFGYGTAEKARIDSSGRLLIATTTTSGTSTSGDDIVIGSIGDSTSRGITFATTSDATIRWADAGDNAMGRIQYSNSTDVMAFMTENAQRIRIDSDGLKFGSDSAAANALDDYEEGTWTPALNAGETCTVYDARYTKIGRQVTANCYIYNFSDFSGNNNTFNITGLPFSASGGNHHGGGFIGYAHNWNYSYPILPLVGQNTATGYFHRQDGTTSTWKYVDFHNTGNGTNGQLIVTFVYFAAT